MTLQQRKKLNLVFTLLILIGLVIIALSILYFTQDNQFTRYKDTGGNGFEVKYPNNWTVAPYTSGVNAVFYSPLDNALDKYKDNVNILVQDMNKLTEIYSLNKYTKKAIGQMKVIYKENFVLLDSQDITVDNTPGHEITFIGKNPGIDLKVKCVWAIKGTNVYLFTYSAVDSQYDKYIKKVDAMLRSFRIP